MSRAERAQRTVFLEVIEWFDETGTEILHRIPAEGSAEIKYGAQLVVRESQAAILFYQGRATDAFGPGRHTLRTANLPILTKVLSIPWKMTSPLRAEVVFTNAKLFPNLKWGTRDPVAFKDSSLGLIRLRAHGVFAIQVAQPVLFANTLAGTMGIFTTRDIEEYLSRVIVSRFNDHLGEHLGSLLDLPGRYDELADGLAQRLADDFRQLGLSLSRLYIGSITPPPDVQQAIDDKSRLEVFEDVDKLIRLKAAMAMEKAAVSQGEAGGGLGMGMGLLLPALFGGAPRGGGAAPGEPSPCPRCQHPVPPGARFCPSCGGGIVLHALCPKCRAPLSADARFCSACGAPRSEAPDAKRCGRCGGENLPQAVYCNQCGEKLG